MTTKPQEGKRTCPKSPRQIKTLSGMDLKLDQSLVGHTHKFCASIAAAQLTGRTDYSLKVECLEDFSASTYVILNEKGRTFNSVWFFK